MGLFGFSKKKESVSMENSGVAMSPSEKLFLQGAEGTHVLERIFDYFEGDGITGEEYVECWEEAMRLVRQRAELSKEGDVMATCIYLFVMDMAIHRHELAQLPPEQREEFLWDVYNNHGNRRVVMCYLMNYARRRGQMEAYFNEIGKRSRSKSYACIFSADIILSHCNNKDKFAMKWKKEAMETWKMQREYDKKRRADGEITKTLDNIVEFSTKQYV